MGALGFFGGGEGGGAWTEAFWGLNLSLNDLQLAR